MSEALFTERDGCFVPSVAAGGPWSPDHLHGGPPSGLLAHVLERHVGETAMRFARLTVDLLRPVPRAPLTAEASTIRRGRRTRVLGASLYAHDTEVCRATALMLALASTEVPEAARPAGPPPRGPEGLPRGTLADPQGQGIDEATLPGLHTTAEACLLQGGSGQGHGVAWMRLPIPVVAGAPLTPFTRAAALADFGNGVAQLQLDERTGCINTDVTLYLHRSPEGEWLCLEAATGMQAEGIGLVETRLHDCRGPVGRILQAVIAMS